MNEQEKTLAAYKEYLLECANNEKEDFVDINKKYEFKQGVFGWLDLKGYQVQGVHPDNGFRLKKRTVVVNGQTVPAPMDREPKMDETYCYLDTSKNELVNYCTFNMDSNCDRRAIRAGWFVDEQDASEYFKALLGIK